MASTQQHAQSVQQLQSPDPVEVYSALRTIKNAIIGSTTKKTLYFKLQIIPHVTLLLALDDTDIQIRVQATAVISSLAHKDEEAARQLLDSGVVGSLISQIAPGADTVLVEASVRALNALLSYESIKLGVEKHVGLMVPYLLSIITEAKDASRVYEMRAHARIELAILVLGKLCMTEARQYTIANTGVIDMLSSLLLCGYPRLQIAALKALSALSYENMEICGALFLVKFKQKTYMEAILDLARHQDPEISLNACMCASNMSRMRIGDLLKDIQAVVVPALVKLLKMPGFSALQVVQSLGYLCHEDADIQSAAKNAGVISELIKILSVIEGQESADFVDQDYNTRMVKGVFLTLGTIVSTNEECRRKAVEDQALVYLVRAMGHQDDGVKAAACLCTRYIIRSVSICRTHVPESGILAPLIALLQDKTADVQVTASATLVNLLTDFSPLRAEALKEGLVDILVRLLGSPSSMICRNALWSIRNLLVGIDDDTRKEIIEKIKVETLFTLSSPPHEAFLQEHALGALRNVVADSMLGINAVFDAMGKDKVIELLRQATRSDAESVVKVHGLYLANNIAVRSQEHCEIIVGDEWLLRSIASDITNESPEVAVAALWCISSIASHRATSQSQQGSDGGDSIDDTGGACRYMSELSSLEVQSTLEHMLEDPNLPLDVRDRVRSCLDYFPESET
ncbi:hypothetical protein GGI20_001691 [Coemansia sp. BCRC 34301]|nr:hypothetical protein GGI20_001691 [Coemansia sp. BCRC 34301]